MKLTHQRMTNRYNNTPESILDWLEEQLENRGIDAVVYTRYILSLLQEDDNEFDDFNCNNSITGVTSDSSTGGIGNGIGFKFCCEHHFIRRQTHNNNCVKENIKPVTTNKWKHKRYLKSNTGNNNNCSNTLGSCQHSRYQNLLSCHCCGNDMNTDEERKLAVVECLKSVSEQEFGIESFVDELCFKLKNIKLLTEKDISDSEELSIDCKPDSTNNPINVSPKEQAMKYFAAFPALDSGVTDGKSSDKSNEKVSVVKVVVNKRKMNENKWNGQKIIEFMTNSISNDGLLHGLSDESSSPQTLTTTNNCPENSVPKLEALNIDKQLEEVKKGSKFDNNIVNKEDMISKNSSKEMIDSLLNNNGNKTFIYCGDIEKNVLINDKSLVFSKNSNNYNDCNREESDKFQKLVEKFNSNIASIWAKTGDSNEFCSLSKNDNIWSFDSSFSSNQSSASPSPKLNTIDFWSTELFDENTNTTPTVDQLISEMTPIQEIGWESSVLQSIGGISGNDFNYSKSNDKNENWILSDFNLIENINKTTAENNAITLQNHQENSPFIEFNALMPSNYKQFESIADCVQFSAQSLSSTLNSNNLTLPEENLLTSPKTHFQPIKIESFDRDSSDEESLSDPTDDEVNKLVICSANCPNNVDNKDIESKTHLKIRPFSTSLDELASFMGPFNDIDLTDEEYIALKFDEQLLEELTDNKMSDKSTNTEIEPEIEVKSKLEPIMESNAENEPEYQDLCNMINEVLRNGLLEDDSNCTTSLRNMVSMNDWYEEDIEDVRSDFITNDKREKRLSWNCYWDTYDTISDSVRSHQKELFDIENEAKNILSEDVSDDEIRNRFELNDKSIEKCGNNTFHECYDEVFDEHLFTRNSSLVNDFHQNYSQEFNNYCLPEENSIDIDWNAVHESYSQDLGLNDIDNSDDYFWNNNESNDVISDESSDLGQPFRLQMKNNYISNEVHRHRKPCSFFIEGHCKRSDCKYSHDISNITCKYWEEGFCFKAHLCPFLHGYITDSNFESGVSSAIMSKKSYTIESESDFPALATLTSDDKHNTIEEELEIFKNSVDHHFFDFRTKSVTDNNTRTSASNRKLPIVVFMKKKIKKRKDRNLQ